MKKHFKNLVMVCMAFALVFSSFSGVAGAKQLDGSKKQQEKEVKELAKQLEILYDEAAIKDANGYVIDMNFNILEEKLGFSAPEIEQLQQSIEGNDCDSCSIQTELQSNSLMMATASLTDKEKINQCIINKIKNGYKEVLSVTAVQSIFTAVVSRNFELVARKLISFGVKTNAAGIIATILVWEGQCVYQIKGW